MCASQVTFVLSDALRPHGLYPARLLCPWDSPGKNIGVGCHLFLQGKQNIHMQKNKVGHLPQTILKVNSKWITDLNLIVKTIKVLQKTWE